MYRWLPKQKYRVHEVGPDGKTWCQVENNGPDTAKRLSPPSPNYPAGRRLCWCCQAVIREQTHMAMDSEYRHRMG